MTAQILSGKALAERILHDCKDRAQAICQPEWPTTKISGHFGW